MFANPISKTLARLGLHGHAHDEDKPDLKAVFESANGETPTPIAAPPLRIPPHQRHLYRDRDDALRGYSMGVYRPAATLAADPVIAKKAKTHKRAKASPTAA